MVSKICEHAMELTTSYTQALILAEDYDNVIFRIRYICVLNIFSKIAF